MFKRAIVLAGCWLGIGDKAAGYEPEAIARRVH